MAIVIEQDGQARWLLANLGDSRIYGFNGGTLEQISVDHSVVQELLDTGVITPADVAVHPDRHVVTRAVGGEGSVDADYFVLPLIGSSRPR